MNIRIAEQQGVAAFQAGRQRAPALNQAFLVAISAVATGSALLELLDAYLHGWDIANLAEGVTDPTMPSVVEYNRIMGCAEALIEAEEEGCQP